LQDRPSESYRIVSGAIRSCVYLEAGVAEIGCCAQREPGLKLRRVGRAPGWRMVLVSGGIDGGIPARVHPILNSRRACKIDRIHHTKWLRSGGKHSGRWTDSQVVFRWVAGCKKIGPHDGSILSVHIQMAAFAGNMHVYWARFPGRYRTGGSRAVMRCPS
jgi:hypothetical protein